MIVNGPAPVVFVAASTSTNVDSITFDLNAHVYTLTYRDAGARTQKVVTGTIPGPLLTALETQVQRALEASEGWANLSSTITTP